MLGVRFDPAMKVNFITRTYCVQEMDTHRDKVLVTEVREIISTAEKFRLRPFCDDDGDIKMSAESARARVCKCVIIYVCIYFDTE